MMYIEYLFIPQLGMLVAVASKQKYQCSVNNICLSVALWMEISTPLQLGVHHSSQVCPKISKESSISIQDDGFGYYKVNPSILKEEISSLLSSDLLFTWHQDTYLAEPIHYDIQIIMTPFGHW